MTTNSGHTSKTKIYDLGIETALTYGDHLFFSKKDRVTGSTLSDVGHQDFMPADPSLFFPDVGQISNLDLSHIASIGRLMAGQGEAAYRILGAVVNMASRLPAYGLHIGQIVWYNVSSPFTDYVECYLPCVVVGATSGDTDRGLILISSDIADLSLIPVVDRNKSKVERSEMAKQGKAERKAAKKLEKAKGKTRAPATITVPASSLLSCEAFSIKKAKLVADGKEKLPKKLRNCVPWKKTLVIPNALAMETEEITLASVSAEWLGSTVADGSGSFDNLKDLEESQSDKGDSIASGEGKSAAKQGKRRQSQPKPRNTRAAVAALQLSLTRRNKNSREVIEHV